MTTLKTDDVVQVDSLNHLAYGRFGRIIKIIGSCALVRFLDIHPVQAGTLQQDVPEHLFQIKELVAVEPIPSAAFYLFVTLIERDGERRHVFHGLAHGQGSQSYAEVATEIARTWYESGGEWDEAEAVYCFGTHHFVIAEDWVEISVAEYITLKRRLPDYSLLEERSGEDPG